MENEMPDRPIEITDSNISENIGKYDLMVIDCWAPWCAPCKMVEPVIDALAKEMQGKIVFGKLLVDKNRNTSGKYGIMSIPTLLIFKNGKLVDNIIGALPKEILKSKVQKYL
jgi:thioredoxin 1